MESVLTDYHYPFWRRIVFLALLVLVVAVAMVPAVSMGTVNVRISTISPPAQVEHILLKVSQVELHTGGLPASAGWISVTSGLPTIDLADSTPPTQTISTPVQSGRYDTVRISISQASVDLGTLGPKTICSSLCSTLIANVTLSIPPSGYGDTLIMVSLDYSTLLSQSPTLALTVLDARGA